MLDAKYSMLDDQSKVWMLDARYLMLDELPRSNDRHGLITGR